MSKLTDSILIRPGDSKKDIVRKLVYWLLAILLGGAGTITVTTDNADAAAAQMFPHDHSALARGGDALRPNTLQATTSVSVNNGSNLGIINSNGIYSANGFTLGSNQCYKFNTFTFNQYCPQNITTGDAQINTQGNMYVLIDSNNGSTTDHFEVRTNSTDPTLGTSLLRIEENGQHFMNNVAMVSRSAFARWNSAGSAQDSMNATVTNPAGTGTYQINYTAAGFPTTPTCVCTTLAAGFCGFTGTYSGTTLDVTLYNTGGTSADQSGQVICVLDQ